MPTERLAPADRSRIPFLAGLPPAEVEAFCDAGEVRRLEKGKSIFRAGDPGREIHVLIEGEVAIELDVNGPTPRVLTTLEPGTVFGEISYLLGAERTATARATRPSRVLVFRREALEGLEVGRQAAGSLMETIARVLALRLADMDREMTELCALVTRRYPEAQPDLDRAGARRDRLKVEWRY